MKRLPLFALTLFAAPAIFSSQSFARGIDWEGALLDPPKQQKFQRDSRQDSNLPGVGTTPQKSSDKPGCQNSRIFSDAERAECNRKTPLFKFRDGNLEGAFVGSPQ